MRQAILAVLIFGLTVVPAYAQSDPIGGLVGQTGRFCDLGQPFEATVERADAEPHSSGGARVYLIMHVRNLGLEVQQTYLATQLVDEQGRRFNQAVGNTGIDNGTLARQYGVQTATTDVLPALSTRHLWTFVIPDGVQQLTLERGRLPAQANC